MSRGGFNCLVVTGDIGEISRRVRQSVCGKNVCLGVAIHPEANPANRDGVISVADSTVTVALILTNEEVRIAQDIFSNFSAQRLTVGLMGI